MPPLSGGTAGAGCAGFTINVVDSTTHDGSMTNGLYRKCSAGDGYLEIDAAADYAEFGIYKKP